MGISNNACDMSWKFIKSYKYMFWYTNSEITICITGDLYRSEMMAEYTNEELMYEFVYDNDVFINDE